MGLLYKYYGFESGLAALRNYTLGFRNPSQLNDPLEFKTWLLRHGLSDLNCLSLLDSQVGVLSLTRDEKHPLMWSHYADQHRGFAIGYDENEALLSAGQIDTVISANEGDVIYENTLTVEDVKRSASDAFRWVSMGMQSQLSEEGKIALRGIFLEKHEAWRYENEVRVVKLLSSDSRTQIEWVKETGNNWETISSNIAPNMGLLKINGLFLTKCNYNSIKSIILGMRNPLLNREDISNEDSDISKLCNRDNVHIGCIVFDENGSLSVDKPDKAIIWGIPKSAISSKIITAREISSVIEHKEDPRFGNEDLIITNFIDQDPKIYFSSQLK